MAIRYPRSLGLGVQLDKELVLIPIGKGEIVKYGKDVAILAIGAMVAPALEAAQELATNGIDATVVNARFAKPVDSELVTELVSHIKRVVTVEENTLNGGFGNSIVNLLQKSGVSNIQVKSIGLPDDFIEQGTQAMLRAKYGLDARGIARQVLTLFTDREPATLITLKSELKELKIK